MFARVEEVLGGEGGERCSVERCSVERCSVERAGGARWRWWGEGGERAVEVAGDKRVCSSLTNRAGPSWQHAQVGGARWRLVSAPSIPGLLSLDPSLADPSNILSSITMGTEVEIEVRLGAWREGAGGMHALCGATSRAATLCKSGGRRRWRAGKACPGLPCRHAAADDSSTSALLAVWQEAAGGDDAQAGRIRRHHPVEPHLQAQLQAAHAGGCQATVAAAAAAAATATVVAVAVCAACSLHGVLA